MCLVFSARGFIELSTGLSQQDWQECDTHRDMVRKKFTRHRRAGFFMTQSGTSACQFYIKDKHIHYFHCRTTRSENVDLLQGSSKILRMTLAI